MTDKFIMIYICCIVGILFFTAMGVALYMEWKHSDVANGNKVKFERDGWHEGRAYKAYGEFFYVYYREYGIATVAMVHQNDLKKCL